MTFDFTKWGMPVGPEELTFVTSESCNWKEVGGGAGPHNRKQVQRNIIPHEFRIRRALVRHVQWVGFVTFCENPCDRRGIGEAGLATCLLLSPSNHPYPFGSSAPEMCLGCMRPIIGSDAPEIRGVFPTNFGSAASEIPRDGKTSEAFSGGMFPTPLPIDQ